MKKKIQWPHTVQYYETDQMKIVHHSNYIRWFEESRVEWLKQIGYPCEKLEEMGIIIPVTGVECQYKSMARFGEEVIIEPKLTKFNGVVTEFSYEVRNKETGELHVTGKSSHCFLDPDYKVISIKKKYPDIYKVIKDYQEENQ